MIALLQAYYSEPWAMLGSAHQALGRSLEAQLAYGGMSVDHSRPAPIPGVQIEGGVAIIRVDGILGKHLRWQDMLFGGGYDTAILESQWIELLGRADIHTIVSSVHSPGGLAVGMMDLSELVFEAGRSKRTIAYVDNMAASAGYCYAAAHSEIYAPATAVVGSIGVYSAQEDNSGEWAAEGRVRELFRSAPGKARGISGLAYSDADRAVFQARVTELGARFSGFVRMARPQVAAAALTGDILSADLGEMAGLVDGIRPTLAHLLAEILTAAAA